MRAEIPLAAILAATLLAGMAARIGLAAQSQGQAAAPASSQIGYQNLSQQYVLKVTTNEVLLDVRVTRKGNSVTDLKESDFKVYEDGMPQKINSFDLENVQKIAQETGEKSQPAVINLGAVPKAAPQDTYRKLVQNHRLIVLFFDLSSLQIPDLFRAVKSAQTFIRTQLTPADLVAVVTYSSDLRIVQDFTNDRDALLKAIQGIPVGKSSTLASNGSVGEAGGTDSFGNTIVTQDTGNAFTPDETEFNIFNTDEKLAALQSLANLLRAVPGRKSVIHFSSGIEQTGVDNQAQLQATVDAANRADVSFYTLDARGLMAMPPGGSASSASPSGTAIYTAGAVSSQLSSLHNSRETLSTLATDTGGRMFTDLNNFAPVFKYVVEENSTYYLIGYTPSNSKANGKFRRIRVVVEGHGLKVETRPGYYAPVSFRHSTGQQKTLQLQEALNSDSPFLDLPLAVETAYFLQPDGHYYVVLAAKIPGSSIPFHQHSKDHQTRFDFAWRATNSQGKVAGTLGDTLPVKLNASNYQTVLKGNILYEGGLVLPPGAYKLKVVAREDLTGKIGTFEKALVLPPVSKTRLELSSVVVSNELSRKIPNRPERGPWARPSEDNPLASMSQAVLPSVTRVFRTSQDLYVYLQSYKGKPEPGAKGGNHSPKSTAPSMAVIFFRNGIQISEAGPYPAKSWNRGSGTATYFTQVPLSRFPAGRYWMQVNVLDPAADQVAFARVPLAIMSSPKSHQPDSPAASAHP